MTWLGMVVRALAILWAFVAWDYNTTFLHALGIEPTTAARLIWNVALVLPVWMMTLPLAKRIDATITAKRNVS